ncbi:hypothetical protein F4802DRAFT_579372 [Xylaria palmicola]|nr:hypothetical protein F4802DRAFT_579372 [Xylaria palmicola]
MFSDALIICVTLALVDSQSPIAIRRLFDGLGGESLLLGPVYVMEIKFFSLEVKESCCEEFRLVRPLHQRQPPTSLRGGGQPGCHKQQFMLKQRYKNFGPWGQEK